MTLSFDLPYVTLWVKRNLSKDDQVTSKMKIWLAIYNSIARA